MSPQGVPDAYRLDDPRLADRVNLFPESVIREMTRVNDRHDAVNLGQGFPDFRPPEALVEAAHEALDGPHNSTPPCGAPPISARRSARRLDRSTRSRPTPTRT